MNYIYQVTYQLLGVLLPMITSPYISRVLGAEGIGIYSYTYSIASYFVLVAKLGIHVHGNRSIAAVRDNQSKLNQTFSDLLFLHVSISFFVLLIYIGYALLYPSKYKLIIWVQIFYVIGEMLEVDWLFFGLENFRMTVVRNSMLKFFTLIAIFLFVHNESDVVVYCAVLSISTALSQAIMWLFVPQVVCLVKPDFTSIPRHFRSLISMFIPSLAVSLYKVMDKIMIGIFSNTTQVGFYENSEKVINISLGFVTALGTVMLPRMTNLAVKGDTQKIEKTIDTSMHFIMILSIAMTFGIIGIADIFMPVFYGEEFKKCNSLLIALSLSMPFTSFANVLRTQFLIPNHHDFIYQSSVISGAILNLLVNTLLIPYFGAMGASLGTIAAEAIVCIIQSLYSRKYLPIKKYIRDIVPFVIIGLIMCFVVNLIGKWMGSAILTLLTQIILGVAIYIILCVFWLWKSKDELWKSVIVIKARLLKKQK